MSSTPVSTIQKRSPTPNQSVKPPNTNTPSSRSKNNRGKKDSCDTNSEERDRNSSLSEISCSSSKRLARARTDERRYKQQDNLPIVVTTASTDHEGLRKVSSLTVDEDCNLHPSRNSSLQSYDCDEKHTSNTANYEQTEKTLMAIRSISVDVDGAQEQERHSHENRPNEIYEGRQGKEANGHADRVSKVSKRLAKPSEFAFPAALVSEESDRRHRTRSMYATECLVEVEKEILPPHFSTQQSKTEKQTFDGLQDDSSDEVQQPVQITRRGMEVRGFVAPTSKQRQLMRMVSGLGMEDPVFGNIAEQIRPKHASNIFDDMDLDDVPEDMKDMLTLVSDRTDGVDLDDDILDSPVSSRGNDLKPRNNFVSSLRAVSNLHNSCSSLPPLGLDPSMTMPGIVSSRPSNMKKSSSRKAPRPHPQDEGAKLTTCGKQSRYEAPPPPNYTPPAGTFVRKKTSRKPSTVNSANVRKRDDRLAAKVNAIFQKSVSTVEYSSHGLNVTPSPAQNDFRSSSPRRNRRRSMGDGCDSYQPSSPCNYGGCRGIPTNSVFVPPEMPTMGQRTSPFRHNEERRALPSMDALYPNVSGNPPAPKVPTTTVSLRRRDPGISSTGPPTTSTIYGLPPCFSPSKLRGQSKKLSSNVRPPSIACSSIRKPTAAYSVKAKRRDTASTTDMSPSSSLGADGKWTYPENPTRLCS